MNGNSTMRLLFSNTCVLGFASVSGSLFYPIILPLEIIRQNYSWTMHLSS